MNSQSDRPKSLEELKALNRPRQAEVLTLLNGLLQRQEQIEEAFKTLMTAGNAEAMARQISNQTASLNNRVLSLTEQVGKMSESFSTSTKSVEKTTRKAIRSITSTARTWIILTAVASLASTLLLTLLSLLL